MYGHCSTDPAFQVQIQPGSIVHKRYKICDLIGTGSFGKIFMAKDTKTEMMVALKASHRQKEVGKKGQHHVKNRFDLCPFDLKPEPIKKEYEFEDVLSCRAVAREEIDILKTLNALDPYRVQNVVKLLDTFDIGDRICAVMNLLGYSVYDFMKANNFTPFSAKQSAKIGHQVVCALNFLHSNGIVHTDIKPENIVFTTKDYTVVFPDQEHGPRGKKHEELRRNKRQGIRVMNRLDIRLVDFGSAMDISLERPKAVKITTREYRSVELTLEMEWDYAVDMWSTGCFLFDLIFGFTLFRNVEEDSIQLARMISVLGPLPEKYQKQAEVFLDVMYGSGWRNEKFYPLDSIPLIKYFRKCDNEYIGLCVLIRRMLEYDSKKRITAAEAMQHPAFVSTSVHGKGEAKAKFKRTPTSNHILQ